MFTTNYIKSFKLTILLLVFGEIIETGQNRNLLASALDISAALTKDKKVLTIGVVNPTSDIVGLSLDLTGAGIPKRYINPA
jgi:hypothetical protein